MLTNRARIAAVTGLIALLGATGSAASATASAARQAPPAAAPASGKPYWLSNVGNTHSPELERQLAGHQGRGAATPAGTVRSGSTERPAATPTGASSVQGVDVADYQHPGGKAIDWTEVASAGYKFAFVKATEGNYYINPYATGDLAQAQAAGLYVAPYEFANPHVAGGATEADFTLDNTQLPAGSPALPIILDIEYDPYVSSDHTNTCYGLTKAQMVSWIGAFVAEAVRRTSLRPVIYSTAQWWDECTGKSTAFATDPLWIAGDTSSGALQPIMPSAWKTWTYWQYTAGATVAGISGHTDASYLSATALQLLDPPAQSDATGSAASLQLGALTAEQVSYSATGLPSGVSVNPTSGAVSGDLPARASSFRVTIIATPASGSAATRSFAWYVHGGVRLQRPRNQTAAVASPVLVRVAQSDALPGCTLQLTATGLPPGLSINDCGRISGWPTLSGQYQVQVQATDSSGAQLGAVSFGWHVYPGSSAGPTGLVRLNRYRCLALSGAAVVVSKCTGSGGQRWTFGANGTLRIGYRCLVQASPATSALAVGPCKGADQRWQLVAATGLLPNEIANVATGLCLADTGKKAGARADVMTCTGGVKQRWTLPAGSLASGIPGYCVSDYHRRPSATGQVGLQTCSRSSQQSWAVTASGQVQTGGGCLALLRGHTGFGTAVVLAKCRSVPSESWQVASGPYGSWLVNSLAGLCLSDPGDRAKRGTGLTLGYCQQADPGVDWRVS